MIKSDYSYYDVQIVNNNLETLEKYFKALITGFSGCGGYNFSLCKDDCGKYHKIPEKLEDIGSMWNIFKKFTEKAGNSFEVRLNYAGSADEREYNLMSDFTDAVVNKYLTKKVIESFYKRAEKLATKIIEYVPIPMVALQQVQQVQQVQQTPPTKFKHKFENINQMIGFLALLKTKFNLPITKFMVLQQNCNRSEIRFFIKKQTESKSVIQMFILLDDLLHYCSSDNVEKYILDIDDGFFTIFGQKILHGEFYESFNRWKNSAYSYRLKIC